jgi:hypothetical protein
VYISTKKIKKWGTGGLVTHQKYLLWKWLKISIGSDSSSCVGGKKFLSKEILFVVNNGL